MMNKDKDGFITVTLGVFNKPNRNGHIFQADKQVIRDWFQKHIGKPFGEIDTPDFSGMDPAERIRRAGTLDMPLYAGILSGYSIVDNEDGSWQANASVKPSERLKEIIEGTPTFGIRAMTEPSKDGVIRKIEHLVCFDYIPPHKRG